MTTGNGARVLVLGGSGQLGSRISSELARRGARIMIAGTDPERLAAAAAEIGPGTPTVVYDLRRPDGFAAVIEQTVAALGGIDGIVNAAGVVGFGALVDTPTDAIDELVSVDFVGPLKFMRAALPHLDGGFWVNITGVVAEHPTAGMATYSAVKAALSAATRALAREVRRSGTRVIDVRPPHTETGLASRPIAGSAPQLPEGLDPVDVAVRIVDAIERQEREVASADFV